MVSMAAEGISPLSVASVVEDVLRHHGARSCDFDLESRKAEEASLRRYEAAGWLRKMVGVVAAKDLPAEPSEDDFRIALRSGIILCTVLNKIQPGSVAKVVEAPNDSVLIPDGAALMAFQYFENIRNFLVNMEQMGLPTFEASDLEQGGKTGRIVNSVFALKAYSEGKQGGFSPWKSAGNSKAPISGKLFMRKNSEPFMNSASRNSCVSDKSTEASSADGDVGFDLTDMSNSHSINMLVRSALSDRRQDEIPYIVELMLSKVMQECQRRLSGQNDSIHVASSATVSSDRSNTLAQPLLEERPTSSYVETNEADENDKLASSYAKTNEDNQQASSCDDFNDKSCGKALKEDHRPPYVCADGLSNLDLHKRHKLLALQQRDIQGLKRSIIDARETIQSLQMKYVEDMNNLGNHLCRLAHAASGYQKVLAENRKLYNLVQDLKGNIRVYCRVRPFLPGHQSNSTIIEQLDEGNITVFTPPKYCKEGRKSFTFNRVFGPSATQAEVFSDTQPLVRSVLDGYNVCIFAYGQTGTGKTYTMSGPDDLTEDAFGVNYRALNDLFCISEQRKETASYEVSVQMLEIYNEQVRDLLATEGSNKKLEIRNSSQNGINVPDATRLPVSSTADVINLMNLGQKNRAVSSTALNDRSSRSHSCLTVHVQGKDQTSRTTLRGCMHLVDLAGSERVEKSEVTGDRLKEAVHINKSLSALGDVISALAQKGSHVPYRNSKLTQLLQDSLGGQAKTLMFVHISPELDAIGETLSTLKFAERVSTVELGAAKANKEGGEVKDLREQIAGLKAALARREEESEMTTISGSPESQKTKSTLSSSSHPHRKAIKDAGCLKGKSNSVSKLRRRSLDPRDLSPWQRVPKVEATTTSNAEWIDATTLKQKVVKQSQAQNNAAEEKEEEDEFDAATTTSDSSELDLQSPKSMQTRTMSLRSGLPSSKLKKSQQVRAVKTPETTRSMIPAPSTRRLSVGSISPRGVKNVRPLVSNTTTTRNKSGPSN